MSPSSCLWTAPALSKSVSSQNIADLRFGFSPVVSPQSGAKIADICAWEGEVGILDPWDPPRPPTLALLIGHSRGRQPPTPSAPRILGGRVLHEGFSLLLQTPGLNDPLTRREGRQGPPSLFARLQHRKSKPSPLQNEAIFPLSRHTTQNQSETVFRAA